MSRTLVAVNTWVSPSDEIEARAPVAAITTGTSVMYVTRTEGLTGVTNGSPWFGRSNGVRRETHGIQRYRLEIPLARVNSQLEPEIDERSVARNRTTTTAAAPFGSTPPRGTRIVWSETVGLTVDPSTVMVPRRIPPRRGITVLSSSRSIPVPDRFSTLIVAQPLSVRAAMPSRTWTSYVARRCMLVRLTLPGTIADAAGVTAGSGAGGNAAATGSSTRGVIAAAGADPSEPPMTTRSSATITAAPW